MTAPTQEQVADASADVRPFPTFVGEGRIQEAEFVREHARLLRRQRLARSGVMIVVYLAVLALCWVLVGRQYGLIFGFTGAAIVVGYVYEMTLWVEQRARSLVAATPSFGCPVRMTVNATGVCIDAELPTGENTRSLVPWSMIHGSSCRDGVLVLDIANSAIILMPQRFFGETVFESLVAEVTKWISSADRTAMPPADNATAPPDESSVRVTVTLKLADFVDVLAHGGRAPVWRRVAAGIVAVSCAVVLLIAANIWQEGHGASTALFATMAGGCVVTLIAAALFALPWVLVWLRVRRSPWRGTEHAFAFATSGLYVGMQDRWQRFAWGQFAGYRVTPGYLFIDSAPGNFHIIPRGAFSDDNDWAQAMAVVHRFLGKCDGCGYPIRGTTSETCSECGRSIAAPVS